MKQEICPVCKTEYVLKEEGKVKGYSCPNCKYWGGIQDLEAFLQKTNKDDH